MLNTSKSYVQLKKYGKNDYQSLMTEIFQKLNDVLISSKIPYWLIPSIREEILKDPLSNYIANCEDLTFKSKRLYYSS